MHSFQADGRHSQCPACGKLINVRPADVLNEVDRRLQRLVATQPERCQLKSPLPGFSAVVEDVRSLWNVGSIFRSADGAGCSLLFLCGITGRPPRKEIAKTSLGAEDHVDWLACRSALEAVMLAKQAGATILSLEFTRSLEGIPDSVLLSERVVDISAPLCMVVGNEVTGVSTEVLAHSDLICHLPMRGIKESLNVAVAFGIAAYMIAEHLSAALTN